MSERPPPGPRPRRDDIVAIAIAIGVALVAAIGWALWSRFGPAPGAKAMQPGETFRDCPECPEMVRVPSGSFAMGAPPGERNRHPDEGPPRRVQVRGFAIGKYEVTVDEFRRFAAERPKDAMVSPDCAAPDETGALREQPGRNALDPGFAQAGRHPVTCVHQFVASDFARWLSEKTRHRYRLPTEAEWEYAARAGTITRFPWGDAEAEGCRHANVMDRVGHAKWGAGLPRPGGMFGPPEWAVTPFPCDDGHAFTAPVGSFSPNALGLHDMTGNVSEWVLHCMARDASGGETLDVRCEKSGGIRGGSWRSSPGLARSAERQSENNRGSTQSVIGFRVARDL